jgi:hypothetical protein
VELSAIFNWKRNIVEVTFPSFHYSSFSIQNSAEYLGQLMFLHNHDHASFSGKLLLSQL